MLASLMPNAVEGEEKSKEVNCSGAAVVFSSAFKSIDVGMVESLELKPLPKLKAVASLAKLKADEAGSVAASDVGVADAKLNDAEAATADAGSAAANWKPPNDACKSFSRTAREQKCLTTSELPKAKVDTAGAGPCHAAGSWSRN